MQLEDLSKEGLQTHFSQLAMGDSNQFAGDLRELSPNKLKECCKGLGIPTANDKADTIKAIVKAVGGEMAGKKGAAKPPKKTETEAAEATQAPVTSSVMPKGKKGPTVKLEVNPVYEKFIPRPAKIDYDTTKASIQAAFEAGGTLSERIKVLESKKKSDPFIILDGHTRKKILDELNIPVTEDMIEIISLPEDQIELEMVRLNVARRHMTDAQKIKLVQKYLPAIKTAAKVTRQASKEADKAAKKATKEAERAAMKARIAQENKDRKEREAIAKEARRKEREAAKAAKEAEKAAKTSREGVAEAAGVSPAQVRLFEWCEKYAPEYLKEQTAAGVEIGTIYGVAHDQWFKAVKKYSPELWDQVKSGKVKLSDAYKKAAENAPADEHIAGPLEECVASCKDIYLKGLRKKYGEALTPDEYEADYINKLDARITKYAQKNQ